MTKRKPTATAMNGDPLWYKDAVIYELHVRAFSDGNGDGVGDFKGLTGKLDYLHDLGVTALWLLPFYPSPLKDDGYDISNYRGIHSDYGTLRDFKRFLREAHKRNIRVIIELVLNHTSDQHPWFQRARSSRPGTRWRNFYVWSDTAERYSEARVIFQDFESSNWTWDPKAKAYYWHRFYSHQPDLNYDSPQVQKEMLHCIDFWFDLGVDGLRLDAVPYLFQREGTNCENLPETYEFLRKLRAHIDSRYQDKMLLAEANQWPEDAIAYLGDGQLCHMAYHFPLMPRLFMALRMEDRFPLMDIMEQTPAIPDICQWAVFLRNHDELTLEMVTDEERDYMYRVYGQDTQMRINLGIRRRLAPLLGNHRRRIELMKGLLFSLPGTPVIYYGDEIGMGDNIYLGDRNGVRTPMQWSPDRNAGFSSVNAQRLYLPVIIDPEYHHETVNVDAQQNNPHSLLWWTKRLIALRKRFTALARGKLEFLQPENRKVLAFVRVHQDNSILVVANLSRFVQYVELDLSVYRGMVPVEIFGGTDFPKIHDGSYFLSLGPHSFYWFGLVRETPRQAELAPPAFQPPIFTIKGSWQSVFKGKALDQLENVLPHYLQLQRWFGGKGNRIKGVKIREVIRVSKTRPAAVLLLVRVNYVEGDPEVYNLPLGYTSGDQADAIMREHLDSIVAFVQLSGKSEKGIIYDAPLEPEFCNFLLKVIGRRRRIKGVRGELTATSSYIYRQTMQSSDSPLEPTVCRREQTNTSIGYSDRFMLKLFRRITPGVNPDLEIGRFLTNRNFTQIPPLAGSLEYQAATGEPVTLATLQQFVVNQGDAWSYTLDILNNYFEYVITHQSDLPTPRLSRQDILDLASRDVPSSASEIIGAYLDSAGLLGQRTAELHLALSTGYEDPDFATEPFSKLYQRSLYQSMRSLAGRVFRRLRRNLGSVPDALQPEAQRALGREKEAVDYFRSISKEKIAAKRLRCHGDYHLGQVLYTGKDFVIMDFEGEPDRPISERRIKRSPLRDVAGMLRSFNYAAFSTVFSMEERGLIGPDEALDSTESWAYYWYEWVAAAFLRHYLERASEGDFLPRSRDELRTLLNILLLEKALYEMGYELNNRPNWLKIPLRGFHQLLDLK